MQELRLFSAEELSRASAQIADTFGEAHKAGLPADAALRGAGEKFADMVIERAGAVAGAMQQQGPAAAQRRRSGEAELAAQWGEALGLYYMATLAAAELGVLSAARHRRAQAHPDSCQAALAWLHARACQTSFEVHALPSAGYPGGAYARLNFATAARGCHETIGFQVWCRSSEGKPRDQRAIFAAPVRCIGHSRLSASTLRL